jgi:hypothetical protein
MRVLLRGLYSAIFAVVGCVVGFKIIAHLLILWEYSPAWVNYVGAYLAPISILTMPILFVQAITGCRENKQSKSVQGLLAIAHSIAFCAIERGRGLAHFLDGYWISDKIRLPTLRDFRKVESTGAAI